MSSIELSTITTSMCEMHIVLNDQINLYKSSSFIFHRLTYSNIITRRDYHNFSHIHDNTESEFKGFFSHLCNKFRVMIKMDILLMKKK